jgi:hypothetical membrane protein
VTHGLYVVRLRRAYGYAIIARVNRGAHARGVAAAAVIGVAVYFAVDVLLVFLRPHFSVLHNAESDYGSAGAWGWVMNANFLLRCALSLAVVYALARVVTSRSIRPALCLLGVWAVTSGLLAFFPDDPVGTGTKTLGTAAKTHQVLALIAFPCVLVGTIWASRVLRREPGWAPISAVLRILSWLAIVPILALGRVHLKPHSLGGLWEKTFLGIELVWFLVAAAWIAWGGDPGALQGGPGQAGR